MTHYTIRPILWKHKKNDKGLSPLMIVVTISRKRTYIKTSYKLTDAQWDEDKREVKNLHNAAVINAAIRKQISELEKEIIVRQIEGRSVTAHAIKHAPMTNFYSFVREVKGNSTADKKEMNRIGVFAGAALQLSDIDVSWLRKYEQHERRRTVTYKGENKKGMSQNTINTTFKWLRRVMNLAKKEGLIKQSPFEDYDLPKYEQSERIFLTEPERKEWTRYWEQRKVTGSLHITLTYFLIGMLTGLRHSDWGKVNSKVHGDYLRLRAKKNKEWVVMPIGKTLRKLLKESAKLPPPFSGDKTRDHLKIISGRMGSDKHVTTHTARHSFGCMCAELKLPKSVTAELMAINVRTVEVYYHLTGENIALQAAALKGV